jgi:hypothetical protein
MSRKRPSYMTTMRSAMSRMRLLYITSRILVPASQGSRYQRPINGFAHSKSLLVLSSPIGSNERWKRMVA